MLKMIIADDEEIVREGLTDIFPWSKYGIQIIGQATDGEEALALCQELNPDILLTDIRMPFMDGLEVAKKLREDGSKIKIIIISGYEDFNYAKTALRINVEDYILKPVKIPEMERVIEKIVKDLQFENESENKFSELSNQLYDNKLIIKKTFLYNLINGYYTDKEEVYKKLKSSDITFIENDTFTIAVLKVDDYPKVIKNCTSEDVQLLNFAICNVIEEIIHNAKAGISFSVIDNEFIIMFNNILICSKQRKICEEIISHINKLLKQSASIGIGNPENNIMNLHSSYINASTALRYKFFTGKNSILDTNDINDLASKNIPHINLQEIKSEVIGFIKLGDNLEISNLIEKLFNTISLGKMPLVEYVQSICIEILNIACRTLYQFQEDVESILGNQIDIINNIYSLESITELKEYITSIVLKISNFFTLKFAQKNSKTINQIKEIISMNYKDNITISMLSEEVYLSPNYISQIFKQETGETITDYITGVRIKKAKELLQTTSLKVLEIAEAIGYDNPHYFSALFKKQTGFMPLKYRSLSNK